MTLQQVIVVNDFAHVNGGAAQVAITSAVALAKSGLKVQFFAGVGPIDPILTQSEISVTILEQHEVLTDPNRLRAIGQGIWNPKAYARMRDLLRWDAGPGTVVHLHGWMKCLSASVGAAVFKTGVPLVVTLHDYILGCPNAGFYDYQADRICERRGMSPGCIVTNSDKRSYVQKLWRVVRQSVQSARGGLPRHLKFAITPSKTAEEILRPYLPDDCRVFLIGNPIDAVKGKPVDPNTNSSFLFVGRLSPEKGPLLFAEAAQRSGVEAVFVGDGELSGVIRASYPSTSITGWLAKEGVAAHLLKARALVFPSKLYETQGMAVWEAAALGVPAIVPDRCAAKEFVEHDRSGLIFRTGDANSLAGQIARLKDGALAARLGAEAYRKFWSQPPTLDRHVEQLRATYEVMVNTKSESSA